MVPDRSRLNGSGQFYYWLMYNQHPKFPQQKLGILFSGELDIPPTSFASTKGLFIWGICEI